MPPIAISPAPFSYNMGTTRQANGTYLESWVYEDLFIGEDDVVTGTQVVRLRYRPAKLETHGFASPVVWYFPHTQSPGAWGDNTNGTLLVEQAAPAGNPPAAPDAGKYYIDYSNGLITLHGGLNAAAWLRVDYRRLEMIAHPKDFTASTGDQAERSPSFLDLTRIVQTADSGFLNTTLLQGNSVPGAKLVNGSVTATQLASDAVTTAKILDANVTTAKILDANVTPAKLYEELHYGELPLGILEQFVFNVYDPSDPGAGPGVNGVVSSRALDGTPRLLGAEDQDRVWLPSWGGVSAAQTNTSTKNYLEDANDNPLVPVMPLPLGAVPYFPLVIPKDADCLTMYIRIGAFAALAGIGTTITVTVTGRLMQTSADFTDGGSGSVASAAPGSAHLTITSASFDDGRCITLTWTGLKSAFSTASGPAGARLRFEIATDHTGSLPTADASNVFFCRLSGSPRGVTVSGLDGHGVHGTQAAGNIFFSPVHYVFSRHAL